MVYLSLFFVKLQGVHSMTVNIFYYLRALTYTVQSEVELVTHIKEC